jgi:hypothetical protein
LLPLNQQAIDTYLLLLLLLVQRPPMLQLFQTCDKYPIHLKSNAAILEVRDSDFAGTDLQSFLIPPGDAGWDSCLIVCKSNPECQFVVMSPPSSSWWMPRLSTCVLKKDIARDGRQGRNAHFAGLRVGVLIKRLTAEQVGWQWARGDGVVPGEVLSIPGESSSSISDRYLWHANWDQPNTFVCQMLCIKMEKCTHVVYSNTRCWMMNMFGTFRPEDRPAFASRTMVNVLRWNNFDKV